MSSFYLGEQFSLWDSIDVMMNRNAIYINDRKSLIWWIGVMHKKARKEKDNILKLVKDRRIPVVLTERPTNQPAGKKTSDDEFVHFMNEVERMLDGFDDSIRKNGDWIRASNDEKLKEMHEDMKIFVKNERGQIHNRKIQNQDGVLIYLITAYGLTQLINHIIQVNYGFIKSSADKKIDDFVEYLDTFSGDAGGEVTVIGRFLCYNIQLFSSSNTIVKEFKNSDSMENFNKHIHSLERSIAYFLHYNDELISKLEMEKDKDLWKLNQLIVELEKRVLKFMEKDEEVKDEDKPKRKIGQVLVRPPELERIIEESHKPKDNRNIKYCTSADFFAGVAELDRLEALMEKEKKDQASGWSIGQMISSGLNSLIGEVAKEPEQPNDTALARTEELDSLNEEIEGCDKKIEQTDAEIPKVEEYAASKEFEKFLETLKDGVPPTNEVHDPLAIKTFNEFLKTLNDVEMKTTNNDDNKDTEIEEQDDETTQKPELETRDWIGAQLKSLVSSFRDYSISIFDAI